jgi:hypothetical protein
MTLRDKTIIKNPAISKKPVEDMPERIHTKNCNHPIYKEGMRLNK